MIDYIHDMCLDWGAYMRRTLHGFPSKNTAWKLWREQGASARNKLLDHEPKGGLQIFDPSLADVAEIHRIWREMPENLSDVMLAFYVHKGSPKEKSEWLGVAVPRLYELRANAHYYIAGRFAESEAIDS